VTPGDLYWADLPEAGPHLVIVVSRGELNRGNRVHAVPVTSRHFTRRSTLPTCVPYRAGEYTFAADCVAQCDAVGPIPVALLQDRDAGPVAQLPDEVMREIVLAIGYVLDASCEPN
jgi:mRNA-degrading endonuclease toxin of MazEF toxin-antitoxin module